MMATATKKAPAKAKAPAKQAAAKPVVEPKEKKRTKADMILETFAANPRGIKATEVAAQVGCTVARVHEVVKASEGRILRLAPGFYGTDADAKPVKGGTETKPLTEEDAAKLREKLVKDVEFSVHGESGRFRFSRMAHGPNGEPYVDAWGGETGHEMLRSFALSRVRTIHKDAKMAPKGSNPATKAPAKKRGQR